MPKSINKKIAFKKLIEEFQSDHLLKIGSVTKILNKHRSTVYRWIKRGWIVLPVYVNGRNKGWKKTIFTKWLKQL